MMQKSAGCQGCQLTPKGNGIYRVRLRLPKATLEPDHARPTHIEFEAKFEYGRDQIDAALVAGIALSFRFLRGGRSQSSSRTPQGGAEQGWRMLVSTQVQGAVSLDLLPGALGIDVNTDHLALTLMDRDGNPLRPFRIPLVTYGCSSEQVKARIGDAVKQVIRIAQTAQVGIVVEKLDFTAKKRAMKNQGGRYARMLSSLTYRAILDAVNARAFDAGIRVQEVNPGYTSIVGKQKFSRRYSLSNHGAAALGEEGH